MRGFCFQPNVQFLNHDLIIYFENVHKNTEDGISNGTRLLNAVIIIPYTRPLEKILKVNNRPFACNLS